MGRWALVQRSSSAPSSARLALFYPRKSSQNPRHFCHMPAKSPTPLPHARNLGNFRGLCPPKSLLALVQCASQYQTRLGEPVLRGPLGEPVLRAVGRTRAKGAVGRTRTKGAVGRTRTKGAVGRASIKRGCADQYYGPLGEPVLRGPLGEPVLRRPLGEPVLWAVGRTRTKGGRWANPCYPTCPLGTVPARHSYP